MAKQHVHSAWYKVQPLSPWILLAVSLVFAFLSLMALRQNNLQMVKLREQVFAADQANGDVETALRNLREYVYSHMNTDLSSGNGIKPPIQLKYRYERLVKAEEAKANSNSSKIYTEAQKYCERKYPGSFSGGPRVPCIKEYVSSHTAKEQAVPDSLYKFDFISPAWTPDLAGWSIVLAIFFFILFVIRLALELWVKHDLRHHQ